MKLPIPFRSQKKEQSHYYLALLLSDEKATAVVLDENGGKLKILSIHDALFPSLIETISLEELIDTVDKAISSSEEVLPPDIETHRTVFGVKESWVEEETKKIKKEHLGKLKKLCDALDLTPLGFMVTTEAIANYLQKEEGAPLSAIVATVGRSTLSLILYRGGKIVETIHGKLEGSVPHAVDTLLKHFTTAVLPARIILFDGRKNEESLRQAFISHAWSKSLPFLHVPQVTVLPAMFDAQAVTFGAASQMGLEVADLEHIPKQSVDAAKIIEEDRQEEMPHTEETQKADKTAEQEVSSVENFGFIQNVDVALLPQSELAHAKAEKEGEEEHGPKEHEQLHQGKKTYELENESDKVPERKILSDSLAEVQDNEKEFQDDEEPAKSPEKTGQKRNIFSAFSLPKFRLPGRTVPGSAKLLFVLFPLIILLLIIGGVVYFYLYKVHATITLSVKPKIVEQTNTVTFSITSPSDFANNTIAAKSVSAVLDGQLSAPATGTKEIGDKATGSVTVYNNSTTSQTLSAGTSIQSSNGLTFLLDKDLTVASASGDIFSGTKPGTGQVAVTAKDIGTEYNLPSGTKFTIGSNSNVAAKNDNAFSGGSKKQVTVVSKEDIVKLKTNLLKSMQDKGIGELAKSADSSNTVLPVVLDTSVTKANFSKNAGDEAKTVSVTGTVSFSGMSYAASDINQYAQSVLKSHYSQGISIAADSVKTTVNAVKQKNDKEVSASVDAQAGLLPAIDTNDATQKIQGKSLTQAKALLTSLPQVDTISVSFSPNIPLLPNVFPSLPKHVSVEVKSE